MLQVIIAGIVVGTSYALTGAAFAVAYRSSRILNFALGGTGGMGAFICASLISHRLPWALSFALAVCVGAVVGAIPEYFVGRPLGRVSPLTAAIGMLGVLLVLQGLTEYIWGTLGTALPRPFGTSRLAISGDTTISAGDVVYVGIAVVGCLGLLWLMYYTVFGLQMRAASVGPATATTLGVRVGLTRTVGWAINGALGAASAVFVASASTLEPTTYTSFIFLALIALVVGGLSSMWGVMLGGLVFGVAVSVMEFELSTRLTYTFAFLLLSALLLFRPSGLLGRPEAQLNEPVVHAASTSRLRRWLTDATRSMGFAAAVRSGIDTVYARGSRRSDATWRGGVATVLVIGAMLIMWRSAPLIVSLSLPQIVSSFLAVLGLDIVMGYCGQLNLAQGAFVAVGAYSGALGVGHLGLPAWMALPLGAVGGALVGILIGLPAVRLSHLYFAQITLLFAFVVPELIQFFPSITGGTTGIQVKVLTVTPFHQYLLYLSIACVVTAIVKLMLSSSLGRHWRATRDNEAVARSLGQRTSTRKLSAFAVGCGLAGLAGAMQAISVGTVSPDAYPVWLSIYYQAAQVVGGMTSLLGNLLGAFFITLVPIYAGAGDKVPADLVFGLAFVIVMLAAPRGLARILEVTWMAVWGSAAYCLDALAHRRLAAHGMVTQPTIVAASPPAIVREGSGRAEPMPAHGHTVDAVPVQAGVADTTGAAIGGPPPADPILRVIGLRAGYRGGEVLHLVDVDVPAGAIVGVLGPNGAGKSTLLRCITGLLQPSRGQIQHRGTDLVGQPSYQIARRGIAHVVEGRGIFADLSVRENLRLGARHSKQSGKGAAKERAEWVLSLFPVLRQRQRQPAGTLSGGEQQMLAIGRSLLMAPELLVLDEPLLGLAPAVADGVLQCLREIRDSGVSILLVEQNVNQALELCAYAYVLGAGRVVAAGDPGELARRGDLLESYFGLASGPEAGRYMVAGAGDDL